MHARGPVKRTLVAPLVAVALAVVVLAPTAIGHSPVPNPSLWAAGGPERFKPDGYAQSSIRFFADLHISIYTRLTNQPPGVRWILQLYDKGTCTVPKNYIGSLGTITPGATGTGARTVFLDAGARDELLDAIEHRRTIVLRLTRPGLRVCLPFSVQRPSLSTTTTSQPSTTSAGTSTSRTTTRSSGTTTGATTSGSTSTISTMPTTSPRPTQTNTNTTTTSTTTDTGTGTGTTTTNTQTSDTATTATDTTVTTTDTGSGTTAVTETTTDTATTVTDTTSSETVTSSAP